MTPRLLFRTLAVSEAVTWTLLLAGMLIAYAFDGPRTLLSIGGGLHGFVFLAYVATALLVGVNQRWRIGVIALALTSAVVPYATIPFDRGVEKRGMLNGGWRREATSASTPPLADRVLHALLARPVVSAVVVALAVGAVFAALLVAGPPGGRSA